MNSDLQGLIELQHVESDLRRTEAELTEAPRRKSELEALLATERARLDAAKEGLAASQKARRQHEAELQDLEGKRSKYKGQLMEVKTNKEYTAMLHEIENVEREIRAREDLVLADMEKAEELAAEIRREEVVFKEAEGAHRVAVKELDARLAVLNEAARKLTAERDGVAAKVNEDLRDLFYRVAKLRGVAMAEVKDAMCQVCHVKLRLQLYVDLKRNEDIVQCAACGRIFYYDATPVVVPDI